MIKKWIMPVL